ncbi:Fc.00g096300.m01.CDS01 [Cosmosporella sp. VM-42]
MAAAGLSPGRLEARELVEDICKERGYISEHHLSQMTPEIRRVVEDALLRKDEMIGSAVMTLARNLYTSSARFVFELLQNADDNNYTKALERGDEPYVSFDIHQHKVIIECNEDGFTKENLKAICAIGKSSKVGAQGYIGEKGIGFKSVFMAAWKVHIQSNDFSFSFTHRKGGSGLGMVTPVWQEPDEEVGKGLTRITLLLHENEDPAENVRQRDTIRTQFRDLQDTILLFLRKLRRVKISFYLGADDILSSRTIYSLHGTNPVTIRRATTTGGEEILAEKKFHVTKHLAENIPKSENRSYSEDEPRTDASAEVVLAFPMTTLSSVPIVADQDVFAFLPMRPMGFKFLIHTDFVTEASRQGIVTTSLRNQALRDGIADCLAKAMQEFCQHPSLQFQWMRWLPQRESYPWDSFWTGLLDKIESQIKSTKILRSLGQRQLYDMSTLRRLQGRFYDQHGDPLFKDTVPELYLAKEYEDDDLELLRPYGLRYPTYPHVLDRIGLDLKSSDAESRMKSPTTDDDWHSRSAEAIASLLSSAKELSLVQTISEIRSLRLIPLENGDWVSATDGPLYYSHCLDLAIPRNLDIKLVSSEAAKNAKRRQLLDALGVREASIGFVRSQILAKTVPDKADDVALATSVAHLRFLYLSHGSDEGEQSPNELKDYYIYDRRMDIRRPRSGFGIQETYLTTSDPYGPSELLKPTKTATVGFISWFINDKYLEDEPKTPPGQELSWTRWLEHAIGLRRHLRLYWAGGFSGKAKLTESFKFVQAHRPLLLMGTLQHLWSLEKQPIPPEIIEELLSMVVPCIDGHTSPLWITHLPLSELQTKWARYAEDEKFNFLRLGEPVEAGSYRPKWGFLVDQLDVGDSDNLEFYTDVLHVIKATNKDSSLKRSTRVLDLYERIHARCDETDDPIAARKRTREYVAERQLIFIPAHSDVVETWATPAECLWETGGDMVSRYSLRLIYATELERSTQELDNLQQFFHTTIGVPDANWSHYLIELRELSRRADSREDFDWINWIYGFLDKSRETLMKLDTDNIKKAFADEPLIYISANNRTGWHTVTECLWSSATQIQGRVALNDLYPDLEDFFVDFLGVQELTLDMAYDELKEKGSREPPPSVEDVEQTIWAFNSLLQTTESRPNHTAILNSRVFPVRYPNGQVKLHTARAQFAIFDRKAIGDIFRPQAKFLVFTLDEVRKLKPFLEWLKLDARYLSTMVREISTVAGGEMTRLRHPDRDIRQKARGLLRIAVHFNSPRTDNNGWSLYRTLRKAEVYETDGISSELHLSQDGHDYVHVQERSELHIREDDGVLKVYVPRNQKSQGFCYYSRLPPKFLDWMMTEPTTQSTHNAGQTAIRVVGSVLTAPLMNVSQILEAEGIVDFDIPEDDEPSDDVEVVKSPVWFADAVTTRALPAPETPRSPENNQQLAITDGLLTPVLTTPSTPRGNTRLELDRTTHRALSATAANTRAGSGLFSAKPAVRPTFSPGPSTIPAPRSFSLTQPQTEPAANLEDENEPEYTRLLGNVVNTARRTIFPGRSGLFNMGSLFGALPSSTGEVSDSSRRSFTRIPLERDKKIGAAGELFVFELLSGLHKKLPSFSRGNWQSTVRNFVTVHPDYSDMEPWTGIETADIVYFDKDSVFTELLINKGYLERADWVGKTPRYLIEVKTTTGHFRTPFYMSKWQYQRMKQFSDATKSPMKSPTVYVIFRVFNIDSASSEVKVYVNPEEMRKDGTLVFTEEAWSVTPGSAAV